MKNAKRDITLNEQDSIADMAQTERLLFYAFARALFRAERNAGGAVAGNGTRGEKRFLP